MLHFDRSTVKHGTQNIQNDCHQWLFDSIKVCIPELLAGLRGPTTKGERRGWRKRGKEEG